MATLGGETADEVISRFKREDKPKYRSFNMKTARDKYRDFKQKFEAKYRQLHPPRYVPLDDPEKTYIPRDPPVNVDGYASLVDEHPNKLMRAKIIGKKAYTRVSGLIRGIQGGPIGLAFTTLGLIASTNKWVVQKALSWVYPNKAGDAILEFAKTVNDNPAKWSRPVEEIQLFMRNYEFWAENVPVYVRVDDERYKEKVDAFLNWNPDEYMRILKADTERIEKLMELKKKGEDLIHDKLSKVLDLKEGTFTYYVRDFVEGATGLPLELLSEVSRYEMIDKEVDNLKSITKSYLALSLPIEYPPMPELVDMSDVPVPAPTDWAYAVLTGGVIGIVFLWMMVKR